MPTVTIRQSAVYHNTGTYNANGIACKFIVTQLLALDPDLSLAEVITNTDSTYSVRLRVMGSDVGLCIINSDTNLYIGAGVWTSNGTFVTASNNTINVGDWFGHYYKYDTFDDSWYPYIKVSAVGIDGVLKYIVFSSSRNNAVPCMYYGMFTSTAYSEPEYCVGCASSALTATYPNLPVIPMASNMPNVIREPTTDTYTKVSYPTFSDTTVFIRAGYQYALLPRAYYGISSTKGFLNIKWGGLYSLYLLFGPNGIVQTLTGETVTINGSSIVSGGYVMIAS